jgi:hypothetical protein
MFQDSAYVELLINYLEGTLREIRGHYRGHSS